MRTTVGPKFRNGILDGRFQNQTSQMSPPDAPAPAAAPRRGGLRRRSRQVHPDGDRAHDHAGHPAGTKCRPLLAPH